MTCGRDACFHTGLFSRTYKGIYAYFIPNRKDVSMRKWHFKDFCEENSPLLKYTVPLPQRPQLIMNARSEAFHPGWPIRVNARHILEDTENLSRIPQALQSFGNLPLLLDAAVELGRRQALAEPGIIAPQFYHGRMQFLMPLYLSGRSKADLAMALSIGDGYYIGETCLTPQMAYLNARLLARPTADGCANRREGAFLSRWQAIGRRNWLFCNTRKGAATSDSVYSIVGDAQVNGMVPYKYLKYLLKQIPRVGRRHSCGLLGQFSAAKPNEKWLTDVTRI